MEFIYSTSVKDKCTMVVAISRKSTCVTELQDELAIFFIFTWKNGRQTRVVRYLPDIFSNINKVRLSFQGKWTQVFSGICHHDQTKSFQEEIRILENLYPSLWAWQLPNT